MPHLSRLQRFVEYFDKRTAEATVTPISLIGAAANYNGALNGSPAKQFVPLKIVVTVLTAAGALNGDAQLQIGTTAGGAELVAPFALTGITGANQKFVAVFAGQCPVLLGNATIHVRQVVADSSGFASTAKVDIVGRQV